MLNRCTDNVLKMKLCCNKKKYSDGGYGWIIVLCAFYVGFVTDGIMFSFGILLVELLDVFEQDRATTLTIGSVMTGIMYCIGPIAGALCTKYGYRVTAVSGTIISTIGFVVGSFSTNILHLCLTYGILGGFGFGLMYLPPNACMLHHFKERQSIANGIAICSSGVGAFVFNHLTLFLLDSYGWRGTLLLEGGIILNNVVFGLLLFRPRTKKDIMLSGENVNKDDKEVNARFKYIKELYKTFKQILFRDISCFTFFMSMFLYSVGHDVPYSLLPDQVTEMGMSKPEASWIASIAGITNIISTAGFGYIGYRQCIKRMVLLEIVIYLIGISTGLSFLLTAFETKMIYMSLYGIFTGGYNSLCPVVLADLFGTDMIDKSYGLMMLITGIADVVSTPFLGWLFDTTGNYNLSFIITGSVFATGGLLMSLPRILICKKRTYKYTSPSEEIAVA